MHTAIFVQARMGSTRLPGKVMMSVLNKPLLAFLVERLQQVKEADQLVILTTTLKADDVIADFCRKNSIACFRGSEEDVLSRYFHAALESHPDTIVRITSDCPLIDPEIIDCVIKTYKDNYPQYDYVSNSLERTYPRGMDTEVFSFEALQHAYQKAEKPSEREHVTLYLYKHPETFKLKNVSYPANLSHHRWTVDTPEDFKLIQLILNNLYPVHPHFKMQDILNVLAQHPDWSSINSHIQQKSVQF
jgi:spore coat polysaccharide biosynthesis protein SpsF